MHGTATISGNEFHGNGPRRGGPPNFGVWVRAGSTVTFHGNSVTRWRHALHAAGHVHHRQDRAVHARRAVHRRAALHGAVCYHSVRPLYLRLPSSFIFSCHGFSFPPKILLCNYIYYIYYYLLHINFIKFPVFFHILCPHSYPPWGVTGTYACRSAVPALSQ